LDAAAAHALLAELLRDKACVTFGARVFSTRALDDTVARIRTELAGFHRERPQERGLAIETLRSRLAPRATVELVDAAVAHLKETAAIRAAEDRLSLASHTAPDAAADSAVARRVDAQLRTAGLTPPEVTTLAVDLGESLDHVTQALGALARAKRLVRLGELHYHADALRDLKERMIATRLARPANERVTLDVGAFKAQYALTRKHAIPLLEWLDREGVTRRMGDLRVVVPR
jgi:selenocysteine-specific elongation factor